MHKFYNETEADAEGKCKSCMLLNAIVNRVRSLRQKLSSKWTMILQPQNPQNERFNNDVDVFMLQAFFRG